MRAIFRPALLCAASVALTVAPASAGAAPKAITGTLSQPGYTLIALAPGGKAKSVRAGSGRFTLRPPAETFTLHLRAANGVYTGPVVVRGGGRRVILGVRAGARLGRIIVRDGYARVARGLATRWVDPTHWARARAGRPIGAGTFGRVRSTPPRRSVAGDRDADGIPDVLDVDDDGDLVLDSVDRSRIAHSSQAENAFRLGFSLWLDLSDPANANAPGVSDAQIEPLLEKKGVLGIDILPGDSAELDCGAPQSRTDPTLGGLVYCTSGGTGAWKQPTAAPELPFPGPRGGSLDPDGDGYGTLMPTMAARPNQNSVAFLFPHTTTDHIGTGDLLIQRVTTGGVETQYLSTLQYTFATGPGLVSYDDGRGDSRTISYPVSPDGPGTRGHGLPVKAGDNGDVVVTLTFWRPQRRPIPGEPGYSDPPTAWTDIGHLNYMADIAEQGLDCQQNAFSSSDSNLVPGPFGRAGGFTDQAPDQPANGANTFTYTLNLTQCLKDPTNDEGVVPGFSFDRGEERDFAFFAETPALPNIGAFDSMLNVSFTRQ